MNIGVLNNERALLDLISGNDEKAFATLFRHYSNLVYGIAFKLTASALQSEEVVQEVFLKLWLKRKQLAEIRDIRAFLFIVTRNYIYRLLREKARRHHHDLTLAQEIAGRESASYTFTLEKECNALLQNAIERLPRQQKNAYHLIKELGLKRSEAAQILHIQPETIKYHLSEAMKNLRRYCLPYLEIIVLFSSVLNIV